MAFSEATREQILKNANYKCEKCGTSLVNKQWHAHHKHTVASGGSDAPSNGMALCIPCHEKTPSYGG